MFVILLVFALIPRCSIECGTRIDWTRQGIPDMSCIQDFPLSQDLLMFLLSLRIGTLQQLIALKCDKCAKSQLFYDGNSGNMEQ